MTSIEFTVPIEPRGWARARKNGNRFFKDEKTAAFERAIAKTAMVAMKGKPLLAGPIALSVVSHFQVPTSWSKKKRDSALKLEIRPTGKPDWDNCGKAISDALNGVVYTDDAQIVSGSSDKYYSEVPSIQIAVRELKSRSAGPARLASPLGSGQDFQEGRSG